MTDQQIQLYTTTDGSFLFLWYLRLNQHRRTKRVERLINDNTLVTSVLISSFKNIE
ncbi:MAG: hypothetical protein VYA55_16915 [Pseudomonadota bacterium]|nr:hypothetical protein [Pseudomonadota bacterium]